MPKQLVIPRLSYASLSAGLSVLTWGARAMAQQAPGGATGPGMEPTPLPHPDLPPPEIPVITPSYWWLWALAGLAVVGLGVLIWALVQSKISSPPALPKARRKAIQALKQLQAQSAELSPSDTATRVSAIIREYLQLVYHVPAPRRASRELFRSQSALPSVKAVAPLADLWDQLAFGPPVSSTHEASALIDKALHHVEGEMDLVQLAPVK